MAKRRRVESSSDEYSDAESDFKPSSSKTKGKGKTKNTRKKSKAADLGDDVELCDADVELREDPHPAARHIISSAEPIRSALLEWYEGVRDSRGMPWRTRYDASLDAEARSQRAYEVWISEIMLQQTQVATVIPYYNRWMEKFPTIAALAASDIDTVNSLWKGLGYYSRAARLLAGAQKVVAHLGGRLPNNAKDMEAQIPGIGRYSAGAICSIAYGERMPVLDGNVHRLMSRLLALHAPPKAKPTLDVLWAGATAMVEDASCPGDVNQALIELGSTVCKVRDPLCGSCPVSAYCKAYQNSEVRSANVDTPEIEELCTMCAPLPISSDGCVPVTSYPMKVVRKKAREETDIVHVVEWRSPDNARYFLLVRRPEGGLLAGLHEFPTLANVSAAYLSEETLATSCDKILSQFVVPPLEPYSKGAAADASTQGALRIKNIKPAGDVVHVFSHIRKTYRVRWVVMVGGGDAPPALVCSAPSDDGAATKKSRGKKSAAVKGASTVKTEALSVRWLPSEEVTNSNIGTGVLKVWNQAKILWEKD
ncbi:hypothetical protein PLICRDRAFT_37925 [Plicaturopsis crispa FD-325 SS-3]|nr:hypothetical protein PLICRDRAFT_37925 [Plicaturopsis crispa FD-325 SS-3]